MTVGRPIHIQIPGFSGSPYAYGKGTLATFLWELDLLKSLGLKKTLPVFITETGWQHSFGKQYDTRLLSPDTLSSYLTAASQSIWQNPYIAAITPFVFNYQDYPFDHFSFKKLNAPDFYTHYTAYRQIPKTKGVPRQRESVRTDTQLLPNSMVMQSTYTISTLLQNTGQSIFYTDKNYELRIRDNKRMFASMCDPIPELEPNEQGMVRCSLKAPNEEGNYTVTVSIIHGPNDIPVEQTMVKIIPPPSATIRVELGFNKNVSIPSATVLVYDVSDILLHKFTNVPIQNGILGITGLYQVIPRKTVPDCHPCPVLFTASGIYHNERK